ncbi:aminoacetone oxidase family FAD-binding enzyme [Salegentibacter sp. BLCTC]|uniref:NAD(P)/FAD-dependent oxidoreductase n=1 Tax=Salegentibacter sp. BLCTC TaxID=2697368 RepID=UPI00187BA761|nr:NAD(P)/FAD-dependent oxidoreductase [Salegentibacter sp. BLCTC]MBE7640687.1 aminoacetone oxidase family FAD-binding enzyme [Salegentibacter sp. BLCTC]
MQHFDIIIIGGGAAGFFTAINAAENNPGLKIAILERGKEVLTKVKISGGGRCNVTHAEFVPKELSLNYPRGEKELLGPFHGFMTGDTMEWFQKRGIELKIEEDGRIFPVSDDSQSIINCFLREIESLKIQVFKSHAVQNFQKKENCWDITTSKGDFSAEKIMLATGSNPKMWSLLKKLGHEIIEPVPSLFTFNIQDERIKDLPGIATEAKVKIKSKKINLESKGPLLITHWGMSGPGILKLSAWGARDLEKLNYQFEILVNWLPGFNLEEVLTALKDFKSSLAKQQVVKNAKFDLPKRLWKNLVLASKIEEGTTWADLNKHQLQNLSNQLARAVFKVNGKSTFKEEFVTAGGVNLKEVDFKTFESKLHKNLFLAGEVLNIDAITGGFNFQNAWTGGFLAAKAMSKD